MFRLHFEGFEPKVREKPFSPIYNTISKPACGKKVLFFSASFEVYLGFHRISYT